MGCSLTEIDVVLSEKLGYNGENYVAHKHSIVNNLREVSNVLQCAEDDVIPFCTGFFKHKKRTAPISIIQKCKELSQAYDKHMLVLMPLLLTIASTSFITTEDDIAHFFYALSKKAKISAAELGDEDNESFLKACVTIIDYSFFEELEARDISITSKNTNFVDAVNDEFKHALWDRVDEKLSLLKELKKRVFSDGSLLDVELDSINIDQRKGSLTSEKMPGNI